MAITCKSKKSKSETSLALTTEESSAWNRLTDFVDKNYPAKEPRRGHLEMRVLPIDESVRVNAIRYALGYWSGKKPSAMMRELGINWGVITLARAADARLRVILDKGSEERRRILALKAEERLEMMLDGEIDERTANARAVMFALERLNKANYADARGKRADDVPSGEGARVVYNINIQPMPCENRATDWAQTEIIDADCTK